MTTTIIFSVLPDFPMTIRSRIHFLLEPPSSAGGPEKLFRFYEEIGGNKLLNERWALISFIISFIDH